MYKPRKLGHFQKRARRQLPCCRNVAFPFDTHSGDSIYSNLFVQSSSSQNSASTTSLERGFCSFSSFPNSNQINHYISFLIANRGTKSWNQNRNVTFQRHVASPSSVDNVDTVWRQTTERLLHDTPVGSFTENNWNECQKCILWWLETPSENGNMNDSLRQPFLLLDRICVEVNSMSTSAVASQAEGEGVIEATNGPKSFDTDLLNLVINFWRISVSESSAPFEMVDELFHPQNIIERLHGFHTSQSYIKPNTQTYAMVIDGASAFNDTGVLAAERLFEWLMDESPHNIDLRPNVYTFTSLMDGWNKSGRPEAAKKVQDLLNRMELLDLEHPDWEIAPNIFSYSVAVDSWAKHGNVEEVENLLHEMSQKYTELDDEGLNQIQESLMAILLLSPKQASSTGQRQW